MVVYDISRRETFEHVAEWLNEAKANLGGPHPGGGVFQLVGHKADLEAQRQVLYEEGEYFAKHHRIKFLESSALTGKHVEEAFLVIAREIYSRLETGQLSVVEGWDGIKSGMIRRSESFAVRSEFAPDSPSADGCYC